MLDSHNILVAYEHWGLRPILFSVGSFNITSYAFFVGLGTLLGAIVYWRKAIQKKQNNEHGFFIVLAGFIGGALGSKILALLVNYQYVAAHFSDVNTFLYGRTLVGGLIGGLMGVLITKKRLHITQRMGNAFAPAIALGVSVGRIGCFLTGCCIGKITNLPWGVNFGDGVMRHPTQIYESLFMLGMFFYLEKKGKDSNVRPGEMFTILMLAYFVFRFFLEFIKEEKAFFLGLTIFQIISIFVIIYLIGIKEKIIFLINKKYYGTAINQ